MQAQPSYSADPQFAQNAIHALLQLVQRGHRVEQVAITELNKAAQNVQAAPGNAFGYLWRLANSASQMAELGTLQPIRLPLLSIASDCYDICAATDPRFNQSALSMAAKLQGTRLDRPTILSALQEFLAPGLPKDSHGIESSSEFSSVPLQTDQDEPLAEDGTLLFLRPNQVPLSARLSSILEEMRRPSAVIEQPPGNALGLTKFKEVLGAALAVADRGRVFTEFKHLDDDLAGLCSELETLNTACSAYEMFEWARQSRQLAKSIDFRSATPEDFRAARRTWLLACFWNSALISFWTTNRPNAILDFIGYLICIQAQFRYSDAHLLLLLRVSFGITRIATDENLIPLQFLRNGSDDIPDWVKYTVGVILVRAGPGRVLPSRVTYDPRLGTDGGFQHAPILLSQWVSPSDRAAAAVLLLEMGGWSAERACRLISQALPDQPPAVENWSLLVTSLAKSMDRVRVVRPNPWEPGSQKLLTVQREAIALLAADVRDRHYHALGGDLTLLGHHFHRRRVPTFVCKADFGPLGLFKLDALDRIEREQANFDRYAQRLHPRYRASRCDSSLSVVTEPDDNKQFIKGLLTSYVFTEDETPSSLNDWLKAAEEAEVKTVLDTLFLSALQPWYRHAVSGTVDILSEFPIFSESALERFFVDLASHHGINLRDQGDSGAHPGHRATKWVAAVLAAVRGQSSFGAIEVLASELQVTRTYRSVVHGDLHLDNILVIGRSGGEYPCLIDFEATHDGYILKDLGRFSSAALTRLFEWNASERVWLQNHGAALLLGGEASSSLPDSTNLRKLLLALQAATAGVLLAWRAGSRPTLGEWAVTLIASLLPYARYPDTPRENSVLALALADQLVIHLEKHMSGSRE